VPEAAYAAAEARAREEGIPPGMEIEVIGLYSEGRQNSVLHAMRAGLTALRLGRFDLARRLLDGAIAEVEALQEGAPQAERAKGVFVAEREKWFKGEPYERAALFFYRGLLYLQDQDFGNAAACFKRCQLQDLRGDDAKVPSADWGSAEWGLALASLRQGFPDEAAAALARAAAFPSRQGDLPPPRADQNLLLVVEAGEGPIKVRGGRQGELLLYTELPLLLPRFEVRRAGALLAAAPPAEDLFFQASTRGERAVDRILADKADFAEGTGAAATLLGVAAIGTAASGASDVAAGALGAAALGSAIASASSRPGSDVRRWDNLPHSIFLFGLAVPPGPNVLEVVGLDPSGRPAQRRTLEFTAPAQQPPPLAVRFLRF
jgi:tetratricopeptide (TPR) repeat protein